MSNSFNISVKPEIAAVETKIDIIDTEVDTIRATDLPGIDTKADTIDTVVDSIRSTDVVNIQTNIDANETKIDTANTAIDLIKAKTDNLPQKVRGRLYSVRLQTTNSSLQDVVNVTGQGKLEGIVIRCADGADTVEVSISIDGLTATVITHTGDTTAQEIICYISTGATPLRINKTPFDNTDMKYIWGFDYSISLLIQVRRSAGSAGNAECAVIYSLDSF